MKNSSLKFVSALSGLLCAFGAAQAQVPSNPYDYTRTRTFSYFPNGALQTETTEPTNAPSCSVVNFDYDPYGNAKTATSSNCAGASGRAVFEPRTNSATFDAIPAQAITVAGTALTVAVPAGVFKTSATNATRTQSESLQYDPRRR